MTTQKTRRGPNAALAVRRELRRSSTRRELVRAGKRLFSEQGIYDSRIEDITQGAGIAKGTLYLHFRDKEELVQAVVVQGFEELRAFLAARLEGREDPEEIVATLFSAHVEFYEAHPDLMRIFHQVRGVLKFDRPRWRRLRTELRRHIEFLADCLSRGETRSVPIARRREVAVFLLGSASGTCSVQVSAYPGTGRMAARQARWAPVVAHALIGAEPALAGGRSRRKRRP